MAEVPAPVSPVTAPVRERVDYKAMAGPTTGRAGTACRRFEPMPSSEHAGIAPASAALAEISGGAATEALLDGIFARFCIGK